MSVRPRLVADIRHHVSSKSVQSSNLNEVCFIEEVNTAFSGYHVYCVYHVYRVYCVYCEYRVYCVYRVYRVYCLYLLASPPL